MQERCVSFLTPFPAPLWSSGLCGRSGNGTDDGSGTYAGPTTYYYASYGDDYTSAAVAAKRYKTIAAGAAPYGVQVYPAGVCVVDGCYVVQVRPLSNTSEPYLLRSLSSPI